MKINRKSITAIVLYNTVAVLKKEGFYMKKIRIGCGAGCSFDRIEPAIELVEKGSLDYIVFECLAERTIANDVQRKEKEKDKGYTPMLEERIRSILLQAKKNNIKIITNMGSANPEAAVKVILEIAQELGIGSLKIAMHTGDDITDNIHKYKRLNLWESKDTLENLLENIVSANVYLGAEGIKEALDNGADIVVTGRVTDASLFVGPLMYEFGWTEKDLGKIGQATLLGHLLECAGQVTGGYFADPGYKDVEGLEVLGFPIAEIDELGEFIITKVEGSGGEISLRTCKEQLLYEITDPSNYITPNAIVDFTNVTFKQIQKDMVKVTGAVSKGVPIDYKVNIGYKDCYIGTGEVSFGGLNSLNRSRLCAEIIEKRLEIVGAKIEEYRVDYIGYNSLFNSKISDQIKVADHFNEIRLRISGRTKNEHDARLLTREIDFLYTNGPAGSSGIETSVKEVLSICAMLIPKDDVKATIKYLEV